VKKPRIDRVKELRRASRAVIGEPSRGRKRGAHRVTTRPVVNEWTDEEVENHDKDIDSQEASS
jgi:hypothetical protein